MLQILLAPDSLKGSLSAVQACRSLERGARRALGEIPCNFSTIPLADGGEGTVEAFQLGAGGELQNLVARGPLGENVRANWLLLPDNRAVIEMAQASGLTLVSPELRDAKRASTFGTGELIRAALDANCTEILIGIGGSATTDGGAGALQALGAKFLDINNCELPPGGAALQQLSKIDLRGFDTRISHTKITVLCDVSNPLCGPNGAAKIYGPQKGASSEDVEILDAALQHFADVTAQTLGKHLRNESGAGAAGGLGFGLLSFLGAELRPGIEIVLQATNFAKQCETADLILTAEGALDQQTLSGKALAGVARAAKSAKNGRGVPVIAFGGAVKLSGEELQTLGIAAALPLPDAPQTLDECVSRTAELLSDAAERALRIWLAASNEPRA